MTWTPVALLGPLLVAVIVKVTLLPWLGTVLLTVFEMAMSAAIALTLALAESLPGFGSGWLPAVRVAVFVLTPAVFTVTTIDRVATPALASGPMVHAPVAGL